MIFLPTTARSPLMVPGSDFCGSVAPMSFLPYFITPSPSQTIAMTGPELRKSHRPLKKGLSLRLFKGRDFLENGSSGNESWCSSESDSGSSDLASLADKILLYKHSVDQYESDLVTVVQSSILSIDEANHQFDKSDLCSASCIRLSLVKLLQSSGYDAAICATKWQSVGKIPGGEHEFIDVINHCDDGCLERYIIDIDFRSHFEIARAVRSYDVVLRALPPVYVGSISKLKQLLQAMVEAARLSLKQNSMPLPPWRSLAYLQAKWESTCQRVVRPYEQSTKQIYSSAHQQCSGLLRRLKSGIQSEIRAGMLRKSPKTDRKQRLELKRWRNSSFNDRCRDFGGMV